LHQYKPAGQLTRRWAIHLKITNRGMATHLIYQACGKEGDIRIEMKRVVIPSSFSLFHKEVFVSDIDNQTNLDEVKVRLAARPLQNDGSTWNCQDWVMETLNDFESESLLNSYQYYEAK
jgi:hypothetical protein